MKDVIIYVLRIIIPLMLVMLIAMEIFSEQIVRIFMDNTEVVMYGSVYIREMAIAQPFLALDFTAIGIFNAIGKGKHSFVFAILRKVILEIPALVILNKVYPIYGIGYAQPIAEVILASVAVFMIKKIFKELNI